MVDLEQFREAVDFMLMHGTREQCIRAGDMLQAIIDSTKVAHEISAPTGRPPRAWTEQEKADCKAALRRIVEMEEADSAGKVEVPRNRTEAASLARRILAQLGVIDAHIDAAIARCEEASPKQPAADTYPERWRLNDLELNAARLKALHRGLELARKWSAGIGVRGDSDRMIRSMADELRVALSSQDGDYAQQPAPVVDDAMVNAAIAAQDAHWANDDNYPARAPRSVKGDARLHDKLARGAMRAALTAALSSAPGVGNG